VIKAKVTLELVEGDPVKWQNLTEEIAGISIGNDCLISEPTFPEPNVKEIFITYNDELKQRNNMLQIERFLVGKGMSCKIIGWEVIRNHELAMLNTLYKQLNEPTSMRVV